MLPVSVLPVEGISGALPFIQAIAVVIGLIGAGAAVWAIIKTTAQEATIERQRKEIGDYLRRLDYVEPRLEAVERENEFYRGLPATAEAITALTEQEAANHVETLTELRGLATILRSNG